ncbi:MAG: stage 0 sporulation protein [Candidatus Riflebacteria bacterium HGW-Riflebacteria-2]|jgi:cell fate regulator YaaT (PSP1 superfamily)|nr:MAG: stage 0 sporulation protein [Candidatus Riflebacteria bacterium HGW-Riflebacteria-2]
MEIDSPQDLVVTTQHGCEIARVMRVVDNKPSGLKGESDPFIVEILRPINDDDRAKIAEQKQKEQDAFLQARGKIQHHQLSMKLLKAEYLYDYSRLILYFKSESKVDFRDLLKSLASQFKTRIELRQIGVRDETRLLGGIGCCGKSVCCAQFMNTFYPVSTKMAKEQNLSLNPAKLSGICGRLLCCLAHEHEYYASFHGKFPKLNAEIVVGSETARVMDINYITSKILLGFADRRKAHYSLDQVSGRKDQTTGRNLWWISLPGEGEPDLSILLKNLNPPGSGKKKKKTDAPPRSDNPGQGDGRRSSGRNAGPAPEKSEEHNDDNDNAAEDSDNGQVED